MGKEAWMQGRALKHQAEDMMQGQAHEHQAEDMEAREARVRCAGSVSDALIGGSDGSARGM